MDGRLARVVMGVIATFIILALVWTTVQPQ
jgi:hypothetical protein